MDINFREDLLVDKIKKGDIGSFELVFKKFYKVMCVYAESFVREKPMAEEIVSDIFYKIWENRESLNITKSLQAYLFTSVHNSSIKYLEHLKVLKKYNEFASRALQNSELLYSSNEHYPIANLISKEAEKEIVSAIQSLPEQCRQVFCMQRFNDMSYEEIANKLNISINTVRTQMMRALKKLRESLKDYLPLYMYLLYSFVN
jgi:RNA polymerase sigma-70 factor (ECF subfamily)